MTSTSMLDTGLRIQLEVIEVLVREVMTTPTVLVDRTSTVIQAIRLLYEQNITAAPVIDEDGRMVGIVSEMDLLRGQFEADPRAFARPAAPTTAPPPTLVEEVMTPNVKTAHENEDVVDLVDLMITTGVKSVPVMRDSDVVGIVSRRDLMGILAHGDDRIRDDVVSALRELSVETGSWQVSVHDGIVELHGDADERSERIADIIARTVPGVVRVTHRHC